MLKVYLINNWERWVPLLVENTDLRDLHNNSNRIAGMDPSQGEGFKTSPFSNQTYAIYVSQKTLEEVC